MTKKRLIKATIILLIIVKFLHYNSFVFEQYHLNQSVVRVTATVDYTDRYDTLNPSFGSGRVSLISAINLSALFNLKNEDRRLAFTSKSMTLTFDLNGNNYSIFKIFGKNVHYSDESIFEKYKVHKVGRFFVNPQNPEKDIFLYKPRLA